MADIDENVNVQDEAEYFDNGIEKYLLKQSKLDQKANKKAESTNRAISKTKKEKSIYIEMLNLLIENRKNILSYKSGRKAFKNLRENSYERFTEILKEYSSNNGIDEIYYFERDIDSRDVYLEWLYGVKRFKDGINDLSEYNRYSVDYIVDAPYVYHDKFTQKTYLYIELHYVNKIKTFLINTSSMSNKSFLYRVVANQFEMDSFRRAVNLSQKLAMLTYKESHKYTFFQNSDNKYLFGFKNVPKNRGTHNIEEIYVFGDNSRRSLMSCLILFVDVLNQLNLIELWGLLINHKFAYPCVNYNEYYVISDKANNMVVKNCINDFFKWLGIKNEIPIIENPDKKTIPIYESYGKHNYSELICPVIRGIIINTDNAENDKTKLQHIGFLEYKAISKFSSIMFLHSEFSYMCYNKKDRNLYNYFQFIAKYNSKKSNKTSLAAFSGLFYFFSFFVKSCAIRYDILIEAFEDLFEVQVNKDELISLGYLTEDELIIPGEETTISQGELQNEVIKTLEFDVSDIISEQQMNTSSNQYDTEKIYQSMCQFIYNKYKKEQNDDEEMFIKRFKKEKRYGLCFLCKGEKDDEPVKKWIKDWIIERYNDAGEYIFEKLLNCILEHNERINKKTVRIEGGFKKYNITGNRKCYIIILDIAKLDN